MPLQAPQLHFEKLHPYLEIIDIYIWKRRLILLIYVEINRFVRKEITFKTKKDRFSSRVSILG